MSLIDHLEKLKHFKKLYGYKSLKEASRNIGISQVGLSKSIAILENILNTQLIVRSPSGIRFTSKGELLYQFSSKLIDSTLSFQSSISDKQNLTKPISLNLETYDSIAVYFIPEFFEYLKHAYPNVSLNVKVDHSRNIIEKINKKEIDLAIGVNLTTYQSSYKIHTLFSDTYSYYINPQLKNNLNNKPLILHPKATDRNGKTCISYLEKFLRKNQTVFSENFETIKSLTLRSVGIGVLPQNVASQELRFGRLMQISLNRLPKTFGIHDIKLAYNKNLIESHQSLLDEMVRIGNVWSYRV